MIAKMEPGESRTREMQETINHLVLGITMWVSVTVTCVTTLLTVGQAWSLLALLIPFIYTMFPQIQKVTTSAREKAVHSIKNKKEKKTDFQSESTEAIQALEQAIEEIISEDEVKEVSCRLTP